MLCRNLQDTLSTYTAQKGEGRSDFRVAENLLTSMYILISCKFAF